MEKNSVCLDLKEYTEMCLKIQQYETDIKNFEDTLIRVNKEKDSYFEDFTKATDKFINLLMAILNFNYELNENHIYNYNIMNDNTIIQFLEQNHFEEVKNLYNEYGIK